MDQEQLSAELNRLQGELQQCQQQAQAWAENVLKTQGAIEYVAGRIQQLQVEQAQAEAERATAQAEAARIEAERLVSEAIDFPNAGGFTNDAPMLDISDTVQQDAVSDASENGHLDAEFGDPDQHPSEEVIYRQTA